MPNSHAIAGWIAGALTLLAFVPYTRAILLGETRPNRASWFIWAFVCVITAFMYRASGAGPTMGVAVVYAGTTVIISLLSLRYGTKGASTLDIFCMIGAAVSLLPWLAFRDAPAGLYLAMFVDAFAILPTLRKAYLDPASEDRLSWTISTAAMAVNLFAIENWSPRISAYPLYCLFAVGAVALTLTLRRPSHDSRIPGVRPDSA